jgi:hypothetical protein
MSWEKDSKPYIEVVNHIQKIKNDIVKKRFAFKP